ncbi:MAG: ArgR family transcriptional regulator [Spirochaetaceae bacterium]|nr:ArgR family transcriptional regulator [Spirochaetaceae bacterium]
MPDRTLRLAAIRRIISRGVTTQQEELLAALARDGFTVTQSTLSRDLRDLRVARVPDGEHGYRYGFAEAEPMAGSHTGLVNDIKNGLVELIFSSNLLIVRPLPGHASSVARALDNLPIDELAGTIAGDDTVLAVLREGVDRDRCLRGLAAAVPGLAGLSA